ncbi:hypothetical protein Bbelb_112510 [Branchiostoma belcheri]|nr:hypothetical protein Bbelb_112510 [Branchiostoma belcheri]
MNHRLLQPSKGTVQQTTKTTDRVTFYRLWHKLKEQPEQHPCPDPRHGVRRTEGEGEAGRGSVRSRPQRRGDPLVVKGITSKPGGPLIGPQLEGAYLFVAYTYQLTTPGFMFVQVQSSRTYGGSGPRWVGGGLPVTNMVTLPSNGRDGLVCRPYSNQSAPEKGASPDKKTPPGSQWKFPGVVGNANMKVSDEQVVGRVRLHATP